MQFTQPQTDPVNTVSAVTPQKRDQPTIQYIFNQFSPFEVPAYQRAYSWDKEHTAQFIEDLREHRADKPYYLGHFLLERVEDGPVYVIDGQQRLTTLVLFFGCLNRLLASRDDSTASSEVQQDSIRENYLIRNHMMRFKTAKDDQDTFSDLVFEGRTSAVKRSRSQERLRKASHYFDGVLAEETTTTLKNWVKALENAQITFFIVHGKVQATQIFTFQNSRGKKLTEFEKLKAYLMHQIYLHAPTGMETPAIESLEHQFSIMYQEMEHIHYLDEIGVLRNHDYAYSSHPQWNPPLKNLKADLAGHNDLEDKVRLITRFCRDLANTFQHVREIERIMETKELVADPIILDAANSWPLIIKLYGIYGEQILHNHSVRDLLKDVELILFRMDFQSGHVTNYLISRAKELSSADALAGIAAALKKSVHYGFRHDRWNFDENPNLYFKKGYHYDLIVRYVLWKYENSLTDKTDRKITPADYLNRWGGNRMGSTIEHVSSRNPQGSPNTDEFNRHFLNNVGNLVLMPKAMNSSQGNRPNDEKQHLLDRSTYAAHKEIAVMMGQESTWTDEKIEERKNRVLKFIRLRWELPEPTTNKLLETENSVPLS